MSILLSVLLIGAQAQSSAADRAGKFSLDIPADEAVTTPAEPAPEPPPAPAPAAPPTSAARTHFSLDTPIADLIADPRAKAVLDKDMPGLSSDENLAKFQTLSLRRLAPLSGGQLTGELLSKVAYDLAALGGGRAAADGGAGQDPPRAAARTLIGRPSSPRPL
ncbi:MAG: hypothetical protein PGN08_03320 [Sphingomonas taxi]